MFNNINYVQLRKYIIIIIIHSRVVQLASLEEVIGIYQG